mmetsp:Transcript_16424/g.44293  ORF Transcript_16424/g.44293 Transcript_16424/m.44293 type:complete len:288 (+) Transcript_16424:56-919(+)
MTTPWCTRASQTPPACMPATCRCTHRPEPARARPGRSNQLYSSLAYSASARRGLVRMPSVMSSSTSFHKEPTTMARPAAARLALAPGAASGGRLTQTMRRPTLAMKSRSRRSQGSAAQSARVRQGLWGPKNISACALPNKETALAMSGRRARSRPSSNGRQSGEPREVTRSSHSSAGGHRQRMTRQAGCTTTSWAQTNMAETMPSRQSKGRRQCAGCSPSFTPNHLKYCTEDPSRANVISFCTAGSAITAVSWCRRAARMPSTANWGGTSRAAATSIGDASRRSSTA